MLKPTVLLVDDNGENRSIYAMILRHVGYDVVEAADGGEAIVAARRLHPDLVLMDLSMPVIDGWRATQILKSDPATCAIPVVALTAHDLTSELGRVREIGFDGFLEKPCLPGVVVREVESQIGPPEA